MRRYETIVIIDADLSEDNRASILERLEKTIQQHNGFLVAFDEWGHRKLAYEIKKKPRAYYLRVDYCGQGELVGEIERFFRIDDRILKYMTVLVEASADVAALKAEMAEREAQTVEATEDSTTADAPEAAAADAPSTEAVEAAAEETETKTNATPDTQQED